MSLLTKVPQVLERRRPRRWFTLLSADPDQDAPAVELEISFVDEATQEAISKAGKRVKTDSLVDNKEWKKFKANTIERVLNLTQDHQGDVWRGVNKYNLMRMCPFFMQNPETLDDLPKDENGIDLPIPFDKDDARVIWENIDEELFSVILDASRDREEYAREVYSKTKNS